MPSQRQLDWQRGEFYGFLHFGMNTMVDQEWGDGTASPDLFNPSAFDADEIVSPLKASGMRGVILTCKHHDGFCLWPSQQTDYTVAQSPWRAGKGDVVKEIADACRRHGLKFGVYLSPWDRHDSRYGQGCAYDDYYVAQLTELLTNYGEIFEVWLDGANGEGPNGKKQRYDWQRYYRTVRELQPGAVIAVSGPDVRWVGNEAGIVREDEWSVVPASLADAQLVAERSQQQDGGVPLTIRASDADLGSRARLEKTDERLVWYPAEVDVSIRPGWFYHENEDASVRTSENLADLYRRTIGGNGVLLLNVPPTPAGLLADADKKSLVELGKIISDYQTDDLAPVASIAYSSQQNELQDLKNGSWQPKQGDERPNVMLGWDGPQQIAGVWLKEDIRLSQRVEAFHIEVLEEDGWREAARSGTIGYQCYLEVGCTASKLRIVFDRYRGYPTLAAVRVNGGKSDE